MKKLVTLAVAASVLGLSSAAFAAGTPAPAAQGKTVQAQDCSTIKDEKAKAECEKDKTKTQNSQTKAPAAN